MKNYIRRISLRTVILCIVLFNMVAISKAQNDSKAKVFYTNNGVTLLTDTADMTQIDNLNDLMLKVKLTDKLAKFDMLELTLKTSWPDQAAKSFGLASGNRSFVMSLNQKQIQTSLNDNKELCIWIINPNSKSPKYEGDFVIHTQGVKDEATSKLNILRGKGFSCNKPASGIVSLKLQVTGFVQTGTREEYNSDNSKIQVPIYDKGSIQINSEVLYLKSKDYVNPKK